MKPGEVLLKYRCDKVLAHSYGDIYDDLLPPFKESATAVFEIGIEKGDAHYAWRDYFVNAQIYGMDSEISKMINTDRIKSWFCSTTDRIKMLELRSQMPQFDIIIDDASHFIEEQIWVVAVLWSKLKPGGLFVIEDVASPEYLELFKCFGSVRLFDLRAVKGRYDDMLAIIEKSK